MKYVALPRGVNTDAKNKVLMPELRACFERSGFTDVSTYKNSDNVLFEADEIGNAELGQRCDGAVKKQVGFSVRACVISGDELKTALQHAPNRWGDESGFVHDAIFIIAPKRSEDIIAEVRFKPESERVAHHGRVTFLSVQAKTLGRSRSSSRLRLCNKLGEEV